MLRKLLSSASGWQPGTTADYQEAHSLYGSGFSTHPAILEFLHQNLDCRPKFFQQRDHSGTMTGSICVWQDKYLAGGHIITQKLNGHIYPFNRDEIILPIKPQNKFVVPFKCKELSDINNNVVNASFKFNSHRRICLAKGCGPQGYSAKTKSRRNSELNKFLQAGGEVVDQSHYRAEELIEIYFELFESRWGHPPNDYPQTLAFMKTLRPFLFGHVLLMNGKPSAFQIINVAESRKWISFDYFNGGYRQENRAFCPGTIVTWLNVRTAWELCESRGKKMRYSFGKPTEEYKFRWCETAPLARLL